MKKIFWSIVILSGIQTITAAEKPGVIPAPTSRRAILTRAKAILEPKPDSVYQVKPGFIDPFVGSGTSVPIGRTGPAAKSGVVVPQNDHDLLAALASKINASGIITIDNVPILLSHQKKMKIGDSLTINFEGTDYTVILSGIEKNSFTLRLNQEEITRPIK